MLKLLVFLVPLLAVISVEFGYILHISNYLENAEDKRIETGELYRLTPSGFATLGYIKAMAGMCIAITFVLIIYIIVEAYNRYREEKRAN